MPSTIDSPIKLNKISKREVIINVINIINLKYNIYIFLKFLIEGFEDVNIQMSDRIYTTNQVYRENAHP